MEIERQSSARAVLGSSPISRLSSHENQIFGFCICRLRFKWKHEIKMFNLMDSVSFLYCTVIVETHFFNHKAKFILTYQN